MLVTGVYDAVDHSPEGVAEHHWLVVLHAHSVVDGPCGTDLEGLVVSQAVLGHDLASLADRVLCYQTHRSHLRSRNEGRDLCWQREGETAGHVVENFVLEHLRPILADLWLPRPMFFITLSSLLSLLTGSRAQSDPLSRMERKRGHSGCRPRIGSRRLRSLNSDPGWSGDPPCASSALLRERSCFLRTDQL